MIAYYTKYFPGSIFVNYAIISFADIVSTIYIPLLSYYVSSVKNVVRINLILICLFSLLYILLVPHYPKLSILGIFVLRMCLNGILNFIFHMNQAIFPTEFRSLAAGSMNFVGRLFAASSLIVVEYTSKPIVFVLTVNLLVLVSSNGLINEPNSESVDDKIPNSREDS